MADISAEITAFRNAVYGEEVRGSMISLAEKLNDVSEDTESTVNRFESDITSSINAANAAASNANSKASAANSAASSANAAASSARSATADANSSATSANNAAAAASATNTAASNAETARVAAENARVNAESVRESNEQNRQGNEQTRVSSESSRTTAEASRATNEQNRQTAEGNRASAEATRVGNENARVAEFADMEQAFADMQRQIIPQATTSTMGGVIVGDGLEVSDALLSLALTKSMSGTSVATETAEALAALTIHGESIQDGTPTPDAPVEVQVIEGRNLLPSSAIEHVTISATGAATTDQPGSRLASDYLPCKAGDVLTFSYVKSTSAGSFISIPFYDDSKTFLSRASANTNSITFTVPDDAKFLRVTAQPEGATAVINLENGFKNIKAQLEAGSTATPYTPYGSIGIITGDIVTPIDLQGHVLASLPDGTKDRLLVDSAGHVTLEKNVGKYVITGQENGSTSQEGSYYRFYSSVIEDMQAPLQVSQGNTNGYCTHSQYAVNYAGQYVHAYVVYTKRFLVFSTNATPLSEYVGAELYYPLATPQTIDLGYIDMPAIESGDAISVSASIIPVIDATWWERGAGAVADAIKAIMAALEARTGELAEAIADITNG